MQNMEPKQTSSSPSSHAPPQTPSTATTITSFGDDVIAEILLRLPSIASLARAACTAEQWHRVARRASFRRRFRALHPTAPLVGFISYLCHSGPGEDLAFHVAASDGDLAAAARGVHAFVAGLGRCTLYLQDCRHGRLLISDLETEELTVFDPVARRGVSIPAAPWHGETKIHTGASFLLPTDDDDGDHSPGFRVVSVQSTKDEEQVTTVRIVVYDSVTSEWRNHPWIVDTGFPPLAYQARHCPVHAAGHVYWKPRMDNKMLSLDTATMEFADAAIASAGTVGETEDGSCCLVCITSSDWTTMRYWNMKVWLRREMDGDQVWVFDRKVSLLPTLGYAAHSDRGCHVVCVDAGLVLVCLHMRDYLPNIHVSFRLDNLEIVAKFTARGRVYPFRMGWPVVVFPTAAQKGAG